MREHAFIPSLVLMMMLITSILVVIGFCDQVSFCQPTNMSIEEWNNYYLWLVYNDETQNTPYLLGHYVCVNYMIDSINAARLRGFQNLHSCIIRNYFGGNNHAVIAVNVVGNGKVIVNTRGDKKEIRGSRWLFVDPHRRWVLNDELANDRINNTYIIYSGNVYNVTFWAADGALHYIASPLSIAAQGTI